MKSKSKKKLWIVLLIVLVVICGLLAAGYLTVNKAFSVITDSFYKSSVTLENPSGETEQQAEGQGESQSEDAAQGQEAADGAKTALPGEISRAAERYGISPEKLKLTPAEIKELEKKVSFADKVAVLNILSSGLSASEYKELVGMLNDGISSSDMQRAYQILSKSLSAENKGKVLQYYQKYADLIK